VILWAVERQQGTAQLASGFGSAITRNTIPITACDRGDDQALLDVSRRIGVKGSA